MKVKTVTEIDGSEWVEAETAEDLYHHLILALGCIDEVYALQGLSRPESFFS